MRLHEYNAGVTLKLSPPRKRGSMILRESVDSHFRGNDSLNVIRTLR
jgi:hypothetical protein